MINPPGSFDTLIKFENYQAKGSIFHSFIHSAHFHWLLIMSWYFPRYWDIYSRTQGKLGPSCQGVSTFYQLGLNRETWMALNIQNRGNLIQELIAQDVKGCQDNRPQEWGHPEISHSKSLLPLGWSTKGDGVLRPQGSRSPTWQVCRESAGGSEEGSAASHLRPPEQRGMRNCVLAFLFFPFSHQLLLIFLAP